MAASGDQTVTLAGIMTDPCGDGREGRLTPVNAGSGHRHRLRLHYLRRGCNGVVISQEAITSSLVHTSLALLGLSRTLEFQLLVQLV